MSTIASLKARIEELEDKLRQRDAKMKELRDEHDEARALVTKYRERMEDDASNRESWAEALGLTLNSEGVYEPNNDRDIYLWYDELDAAYNKLLRDWNKFVSDYNSTVQPRPRGRPLEASESQVADVLKHRKAGLSLRKIVAATGLGIRTVQTIIAGKQRRGELRKREFNKHRARDFRTRKRLFDYSPKQMNEEHQQSEALIKSAKGLGRGT